MREQRPFRAASLCSVWLWLSFCEVTIAQPEISDGAPLFPKRSAWQDATPILGPISARGNRSPYTVKGQRYEVMDSAKQYREVGIASWYGTKFHGRQTANGEIYDLFAATAAHRSLPLPSSVRVTNLANDRSVLLRVNDRGPFRDDRIIDLSYGAAVVLGFAEQGTAPVLVEAVSETEMNSSGEVPSSRYRYLQLGAYLSLGSAETVSRQMNSQPGWQFPVAISRVEVNGRQFHRVRVGPFADPPSLERARNALIDAGFDSPQRLP